MDKCQKKDRLYNPKTKRCYKSCEQKNKVTHPITKKCRQHCKGDKIRRVEDFRCIKKTLKSKQKKRYITKKASPKPVTPKPVTPKPVTPKPVTPKPVTPKPVTPKPVTPKPVTPKPVTPKPVIKKAATKKAATKKAATKKAAAKKAATKKAAAKKAATKKAAAKKPAAKKTGKKIILKQATPKKAEIIENREEEFIPPPVQKDLKVNLKMFDKMMNKGFVKGNIQSIDYTASDRISDIIQIYLHKKYKQNCPIYPIKMHSGERRVYFKNWYNKYKRYYSNTKNIHTLEQFLESVKKDDKRNYNEWDIDKFLKDIKLCLETGEKLIIIPLRLKTHLNMLFIKTETREIIRFEPHGSAYRGSKKTEDKKTNTFLENLTSKINTYLGLKSNRKFKYVSPYDVCPRGISSDYRGFQSSDFSGKVFINGNPSLVQKNKKESGFCALWSWFFAECVLANPDIPIDVVYKEADKSLRDFPMKIAIIIRGYFLSVNDELKEMKEKYDSITGKYLTKNKEKMKEDNFIFDYLTESKRKLQKKPRKPFVGGVNKKYAFILPDANPDAKPLTS
jgi:hypothetical protein